MGSPFDFSQPIGKVGGGGFGNYSGGIPTGFTEAAPPSTTTVTSSNTAKTDNRVQDTTNQQSTDLLRSIVNEGATTALTPQALQALQGIVTGQAQDPLIVQKDLLAKKNLDALQALMQRLNQGNAEQQASGKVAELTRTLSERLLPGIRGEAEGAGTGFNMASNLLAQDATIRTAEAQNRAIEESRQQIAAQELEGRNILGQLLSGTSAADEQLMSALRISKGAVENKASATTESAATAVTGRTEEDVRGTGSTTADTTQQLTDPLGWMRALGANPQQDSSGRALATFIAAGGDPAYLSGGVPFDSGMGDYQQRLMQGIRGYV